MTLVTLLGGLECPLVLIDTETTGTHHEVDRIVQIGIMKLYPDGRETEYQTYVNPQQPIPPEITAIHGINDDTVKDAPTFAQLAENLAKGFSKCDFAGHNVEFDLDFLKSEFKRVGSRDVINGRILCSQKIFFSYHKRTLSDAARLYLGEEHTDAHDAMADIRMTKRVLEAQLAKHNDLPKDMGQLYRKYFEEGRDTGFLDPRGLLAWRFGEACINFGNKHVNVPLRTVAKRDPGYLHWMLKSDFPWKVQEIVRQALAGKFPQKETK